MVEELCTYNNKSRKKVTDSRGKVSLLSSTSLFLVVLIIIVLVVCYLRLENHVIKTIRTLVFEAQAALSGCGNHSSHTADH